MIVGNLIYFSYRSSTGIKGRSQIPDKLILVLFEGHYIGFLNQAQQVFKWGIAAFFKSEMSSALMVESIYFHTVTVYRSTIDVLIPERTMYRAYSCSLS